MKLLGIIVAAVTLSSVLARGQESQPDKQLAAELEKSWNAKDTRGFAATLEAGWASDPERAKRRTLQVLASDGELFRPTALAALARHGDVATIERVIKSTDRHRGVGERRWLTYALGKRTKEEAADALISLLKDQDLLVRASAATALMGFKDERVLESVAPLLREQPAWKPGVAEDDQHVLQMALFGGFESLTGQRPGGAQEAKRVLAEMTDAPKEPVKNEGEERRVRMNIRGKEYLKLPRFNLLFDLGPRAEISEGRVAALEEGVLPAAARMIDVAEPYFGPLDPAPVRFIIADKQRFSSYAGNSFRPGVSQGNQIVLRDMDPETMRSVLGHEYIHVLQQAAFPKQPRWLMEGMAESLSISRERSVWDAAEIRRNGLDREIEKGVFGPLLNWDGSASSGDQEARLYKMAHLAIDSLRFGEYGDPEVRLFLLMSRIGESENPPAVFKSIYGATPKELDDRLRKWLAE